ALAVLHPEAAARVDRFHERLLDALRGGDAGLEDAALSFHATVAMVERAALPLRRIDGRWPELTSSLLERAARLAGVAGQARPAPGSATPGGPAANAGRAGGGDPGGSDVRTFFRRSDGAAGGFRWETFYPRAGVP